MRILRILIVWNHILTLLHEEISIDLHLVYHISSLLMSPSPAVLALMEKLKRRKTENLFIKVLE